MTASLLKSPGFLLSILADLNNAVVWMVSTCFYQSFRDRTKCNNYNWYKRHFYVPRFFQFPSKVEILILLLAFFQFYSVVSRDSKVRNLASSLFLFLFFFFFFFFFFVIIISSGRLAEIR